MHGSTSRGRCASALAAFGFGVFALSGAAQAVLVWGVDNLGAANAGTVGNRIVRFNTTNPSGTVTTIGATGLAGVTMTGLDFHPTTSALFASSASDLYTINQTTGAANLVGSFTLPGTFAMQDLSWNPNAGAMIGVAQNGAGVVRAYVINLINGNATTLGVVNNLPATPEIRGLAIDSTGRVVIEDASTDQMFLVSAGLNATALPSTIGTDVAGQQGMTINWSDDDNWFLSKFGPSSSPFPSDVRRINATGATAVVNGIWPTNGNGNPEYQLADIAIRPIPEPASIVLLSGAIAAVGLGRRRHD